MLDLNSSIFQCNNPAIIHPAWHQCGSGAALHSGHTLASMVDILLAHSVEVGLLVAAFGLLYLTKDMLKGRRS